MLPLTKSTNWMFMMKTCFWWAVVFIGLYGCSEKSDNDTRSDNQTSQVIGTSAFSDQVQEILDRKMQLIKDLAKQPQVVEAVRQANQKNLQISDSEITRLDQQWRQTEGLNDFIKSIIANACSQYLMDFQEQYDGFPEIFVTDRKGLIVGETNKTSDYYQADESWWTKAFNNGEGLSYSGSLEYDQSARAESIALFVPVIDSHSQDVIGVIKALCDITAIKMEL